MGNNNHQSKNGPLVLIVEDEPEHAALLQIVLRAAGYRSRVESNGITALHALMDERPDLILLDLMMPGLDGFEFCTLVRRDAETTNIPIIVLTAYSLDSTAPVEDVCAGASEYMIKPLDYDKLLVRVDRYLRTKKRQLDRVFT